MTPGPSLKVLNIVNFPQSIGLTANDEMTHSDYSKLRRDLATLVLVRLASLTTVYFGSSQIQFRLWPHPANNERRNWQEVIFFERATVPSVHGATETATEIDYDTSLAALQHFTLPTVSTTTPEFQINDWLNIQATSQERSDFYGILSEDEQTAGKQKQEG
jgi:hypothetical protein